MVLIKNKILLITLLFFPLVSLADCYKRCDVQYENCIEEIDDTLGEQLRSEKRNWGQYYDPNRGAALRIRNYIKKKTKKCKAIKRECSSSC